MKKIVLLTVMMLCLISSASAQFQLQSDIHMKSYQGKKLPLFAVKEWVAKQPSVKGKYQLIDFWGIFAYPCTSITVPQLNELAKTFKKEVVVIGYSIDDAYYIRQLEDPVFNYPLATIDYEEIQTLFEFEGLPVTLLVNPDGKVIWQGHILIPNMPLTEKNIYYLTAEKLQEMIDADKKERNNQ